MSQVVTTANAKLAALWDCVGRWTHEVHQIRCPRDVYQQNYQAIRGRFDHELHQLTQRAIHPDSYQRGADKLVQLAGEIKELEIQYTQSVTAMEQDYQERLDAAHKSFAYGIIDAFGDALSDPWVQDRLRLALIPQESPTETDTAEGEPNTAPDPYTDPEANPGPGEHMMLEAHVAADANPSQELNPATEDPTTEGETPEENPSSGEAKVPLSHENLNPKENPVLEVPGPETNPAQQTSPAPETSTTPQMKLGSETNSALEEDLASQTNPAPQMNSATEANTTSETKPSLEMNVVLETSAAPETSFDSRTNQYSQTNPASDTNPVPETNPSPGSNPASGTNIARDETSQQAKAAHEPNLATASQVSAREGQVANPPGQHEGSHNDASPARSSSNHRMPLDPPAVNLRTSSKRPSATTIDQQQQKRPRHADMPSASEERIVEFEQVFQDGNAQVKYLIAQYPPKTGEWYILECKEHRKHFINNPVIGAAKHLAGHGHGLTREHSLAVRTLGTRVLNCNAALAEKNNDIAKNAFSKRLGFPPRSRVLNRRTRPHPENGAESDRPLYDDGEQIRTQESSGTSIPECVLSPVVGEIYAAHYPRFRFLYPVFVLPWVSFGHFKWKASLLRLTPPCYLFDKKLDLYPRGWAKGYEDGGPLVTQRQYPVIYFDGRRFPEQSDVGWVPVSSFTAFDPDDTNIVHRNSVAEFLQNKDSRLTSDRHASLEQYIVISDDSDTDDPDTGNGVKQENSEEGPARDKRTSDINDENATIGEQGKDSEDRTNRDSQSNGHQGQAEQSSYSEKTNRDNDPDFSHNPIRREDIDRGAGSLSGAQIQSHVRKVLYQRPQPTLPSASERRSEAPFVTGESSKTGQAGFQPHASSGDSSPSQPTKGVEGQRPGTLGNAGQSSQPAPRGGVSQPQYSFVPPRLPEDEDLATLAAQAVMSTAQEVFGDGRPTPFPFPIGEIKGAHVDVYDART